MQQILSKTKLWIAAFIALSFLASTIPARAFDRDDHRCERRIHRAEENLDRAVRKHGEHSRQAEQRRHELEEAREHCRHHEGDRH
jgi:hypothetical protein